MFSNLKPVSLLSLMKKALFIGICVYGLIATLLLFRLSPEPILVGMDPYGTRIIRGADDRLVVSEKENFLKHFLALLYNYDAETFRERISESGDLMSDALWKRKSPEFEGILKELKSESLTSRADILEIREEDDATFQADLLIHVKRRLTETKMKLRVELKIKPRPRREENPYPYEVESYDEEQMG